MPRWLFFALFVLASGCASLMGSATGRLADNVSSAILNQNDLETVRDGAPAYLLTIDGLIEGDPKNQRLLLTGARLYGAYASAFVTDSDRARRLAEKARAYGLRALCAQRRELCEAVGHPYGQFVLLLAGASPADVPALYGFAAAWAGWIQANAAEWGAVAEVPKVEALMARVVELDEGYDSGGAHLYLGVIQTQLPPAAGGQPESARAHFERAVDLSEGRNLMAKVLYAKQYARLVFDRDLHDRLLGEVLAADPVEPRLTLINTLAQRQARELLESAADYF